MADNVVPPELRIKIVLLDGDKLYDMLHPEHQYFDEQFEYFDDFDLQTFSINELSEAYEAINLGFENRAKVMTKYNINVIFTSMICILQLEDSQTGDLISKLTVVDLPSTDAVKASYKLDHSRQVTLSFESLRDALVACARGDQRVNIQPSIITKILRSCFGVGKHLLMYLGINYSKDNLKECFNTLQYGDLIVKLAGKFDHLQKLHQEEHTEDLINGMSRSHTPNKGDVKDVLIDENSQIQIDKYSNPSSRSGSPSPTKSMLKARISSLEKRNQQLESSLFAGPPSKKHVSFDPLGSKRPLSKEPLSQQELLSSSKASKKCMPERSPRSIKGADSCAGVALDVQHSPNFTEKNFFEFPSKSLEAKTRNSLGYLNSEHFAIGIRTVTKRYRDHVGWTGHPLIQQLIQQTDERKSEKEFDLQSKRFSGIVEMV